MRESCRPHVALTVALCAASILIALLTASCGSGSADREATSPTAANGPVEGNDVTDAARQTGARELVHPDFDLTLDELGDLIADHRGVDTQAVAETPEVFLDLVASALRLPEERLALVDKENGLRAHYVPADLVAATEFPLVVNRRDMLLREVIIPDLVAMSTAARLDGIVLDLSSGYRSYEYQSGLFQRHVDNLGLEQARRESAEPGHSQHQLGTTIDFGSITPAFAETAAGRWLESNAWRFGFSLSYPEGFEEITGYMYESWHFRYLGRSVTELERRFFGGVQQYLLEFLYSERPTLAAEFSE